MQDQDSSSHQSQHQILSQTKFKQFIDSMYYTSHILFPSSYQYQQQQHPQSIMKKQSKTQFEVQNQTYFSLDVQNCLQIQQNNTITINQSEQRQQNKQLQMFMGSQMLQNDCEYVQIKVKIYYEKIVERVQDFHRICLELFYFLFGSMGRGLIITFHEDLFIYSKSNKRFMVAVKEIQETIMHQGTNTSKFKIYYSLFIQVIKELIHTLEYNWRNLCVILQKRKPQIILQNKIKKTIEDILSIKLKTQDIQNMIQPFKSLLDDAILVDKEVSQQSKSFSELQKCDFIAKNSHLYKIRNRSINIFLYRQGGSEIKAKLQMAIKNQKSYLQKYKNIKTMLYSNKQELKDLCRKINANFQKYVQQSWVSGRNPIYIKIVQHNPDSNTQSSSQPSSKKMIDSAISKIMFKTKFKSMTQKFSFRQTKAQPQQTIQFTVQVLTFATSYNICVRLHTPLTIEPSTSDQVLQNWNSMISESTHNISLQVGQKPEMLYKKKKYLVIKAMSECCIGQSVICNCFRLMDLAVVGYVMLRSWDTYLAQNTGQVYQKLRQTIQSLNHYCGLMTAVSRKLYQSI